MQAVLRSLIVVSTLSLFSLTSIGADTTDKTKAVVKAEKQHQEARTKDGTRPKACDFRISLS